jgi:translation initiation factor IF-2
MCPILAGMTHGERRREMEEKRIGEVIKYFGKIGVAALTLKEGSLKVGDSIHIVGHTTDVCQSVDSMQADNKEVQEAGPGADVGIKIKDWVREHDAVYKVTE